jgi:hypothetical protein
MLRAPDGAIGINNDAVDVNNNSNNNNNNYYNNDNVQSRA